MVMPGGGHLNAFLLEGLFPTLILGKKNLQKMNMMWKSLEYNLNSRSVIFLPIYKFF